MTDPVQPAVGTNLVAAAPPEILPPAPPEVPDGLMRVWDPEQKKVILVSAPLGPDTLTLTVRLHDPKEKRDRAKSAVWHVVKIAREDLALAEADFAAKHLHAAAAVILAPHKLK